VDIHILDRSNGFDMTSNHTGENGTSLVYATNPGLISSNSINTTNNNNRYEPLAGNMIDAELDSDPQMSDSELSWQSVTDVDSLTATNHWRGWKQQTTIPSTIASNNNNNNSLPSTNSSSICFSSLNASNEGLISKTTNES
jgi:hypothetical protein